ncbi:MAG: hemerythrin family protein [Gallionella sp.]|nr:hemerythrin family protein [Gallionella sp.]
MKRILWWKNKHAISIVWSKQLSVGNATLDSEHRNLIAKINNVKRVIETGDNAALRDAFWLLESLLATHFENEKMFAQCINIDFDQHELAHRHMLKELQHIRDDLAKKKEVRSDSEAKLHYQLLCDWLIGHITKEDMQMKPILQSYPYDHIPSMSMPVVANINQPPHRP